MCAGRCLSALDGCSHHAVLGQGSWIIRPELEPERAAVSDQKELSLMRLAASRSHRSPRMDKVVQAFRVKEEIRRGSVGIKIGLIVEQQWTSTCISRREQSSGTPARRK